jgi:hypothetical protein
LKLQASSRKRLAVCLGALAIFWTLDRLAAGLSFHTLDGKLFYNYAFAVNMISSLSPEAKRTYTRLAIADLCFIVGYVFFLVRLLPRETLWEKALVYAPIFTGICDLLETGTILLVLNGALPFTALWIPTIATPLKWIGVAACFLALLTRRWPDLPCD